MWHRDIEIEARPLDVEEEPIRPSSTVAARDLGPHETPCCKSFSVDHYLFAVLLPRWLTMSWTWSWWGRSWQHASCCPLQTVQRGKNTQNHEVLPSRCCCVQVYLTLYPQHWIEVLQGHQVQLPQSRTSSQSTWQQGQKAQGSPISPAGQGRCPVYPDLHRLVVNTLNTSDCAYINLAYL